MVYLKHIALVPLCVVLVAWGAPAHAQRIDLGADIVSRYVWRGADFGESASVQPALSFAFGGLEVGTWGSFAVNPEAAGANEHDLWVSYSVESSSGTFSLGVTDYYFPNAGPGFFDFRDHGEGAHQVEPYVGYTGPDAFPVGLSASMFVYNEPDHSVYLSASYPFAIDGVDLAASVGASTGESALYGTDTFGVVHMALSVSRSIPFTAAFALPVSVSYILNPYAEQSYLVFGLSL